MCAPATNSFLLTTDEPLAYANIRKKFKILRDITLNRDTSNKARMLSFVIPVNKTWEYNSSTTEDP